MMNTIDTETLRIWLAEGRPVTLLDVRQTAAYQEWALPGSLHADVYDALKAGDSHTLDNLNLPADRPIVTVCGIGKVAWRADAVFSIVTAAVMREVSNR
jgi:rhodanese-related sulfurtransferase